AETKTVDKANLRVKSFLRNRQAQYITMLKNLVDTNTHVRNVEGVNQISTTMKKHLSEIGFSFQIILQAEVGNFHFYTNSDEGDYDILLIGNIDSSVSIANTRYFEEGEQKIFGTGVWHNKGGLVVLIAALQALKSIKMLSKRKIGILLTTDSAIKNKISASLIRKMADDAKYVLGLTGAFLDGGIVTSRSGAASYDISMNLVNNESELHVTDAAKLFSKLSSNLIALSDPENGIIVTPSNMNFNSNLLNIYAHGKINLSIRFKHLEQIEEIESKIMKFIPKRYSKILDTYISIGNKRPVMERTERVEAFWNMIKDVANTLDIRLREEHRWSSSDICFVTENKFKLDGIGPIGTQDENKQEFILKYSLIERSALLAMLIYRLEK
ncbi:MAG: hypothetical protein DWQ10_08380, partial [Calditrichaeota bacterium]